jgi:hypothetical protein
MAALFSVNKRFNLRSSIDFTLSGDLTFSFIKKILLDIFDLKLLMIVLQS